MGSRFIARGLSGSADASEDFRPLVRAALERGSRLRRRLLPRNRGPRVMDRYTALDQGRREAGLPQWSFTIVGRRRTLPRIQDHSWQLREISAPAADIEA